MNKEIKYNLSTYTIVKNNQLSVVKDKRKYTITLEKDLKKGELIQLVPVLDESLSYGIISITTISNK